MARWEPGARERLVVAAVDLFAEQGYDATTVAQIAERAGVTRSTFFRYFPDKRELLVAGQDTLSRLLSEGIAEAPPEAGPLEAVAAGLSRASSAFGPMNHEIGPRLKAAVAASAELQERDILKSVGLAATMTAALIARGIPDRPTGRRTRHPRLQARLRRMVRSRLRGRVRPLRLDRPCRTPRS
jgi:AcrR family transcriptional regulator